LLSSECHRAEQGNGWRQALLAVWPGLLVGVLVLSLFHDKAFTIDDPLFLGLAQRAAEAPLAPFAYEQVWDHQRAPAAHIIANGAGMGYLLVPVIWANGSEVAGHLLVLGLLMGGTIIFGRFAFRIGFARNEARSAALLFCASPAVMAMSSTVMPDIPAMVLALAGLERFCAYQDEGRLDQGGVAFLLLGLAPLFRVHAIFLLGIGFLLWLYPPDQVPVRRSVRWLWPLLLAACEFLLLAWLTQDHRTGSSGLTGASLVFSAVASIPGNLLAYFIHLVLAMPLALPIVLGRYREFPWSWAALPTVGALAAIWHLSAWHMWWVTPIAALGFLALMHMVRALMRDSARQLYFLIFWILSPLPVAIYTHFPAKYLTLSAPAIALLVIHVLARRDSSVSARFIPICASVCALLGILIVQADAHMAALGRMVAAKSIGPRVAAGETVWFTGSWGFHWYAEKAGARALTTSPPYPEVGDLVVGNGRRSVSLLARIPLEHGGRFTEEPGLGGRIFGGWGGAGFYSNSWGFLPWTLGTEPADFFDRWIVTGAIDLEGL